MGDTIPKISYILFMSKSIIRLDVLALIHFSTRMDMISFCSFHFVYYFVYVCTVTNVGIFLFPAHDFLLLLLQPK